MQMQLITVKDDKIKNLFPEVAEHATTANVNVSLTNSQTPGGINLEHFFSEFSDVLEGLGSLGTPL